MGDESRASSTLNDKLTFSDHGGNTMSISMHVPTSFWKIILDSSTQTKVSLVLLPY